jgi:hypothetical protein
VRHAGAWEPPQVCGYEKDSMDSIAGYDGRVIECLQDYKAELSNEQCKASVHTLTERAAQDIRMDRPLADACYEDRKRLCEAVSPGSARVLRCLQDSREQLSYECRATLFDQEVRTRGWSQHPTAPSLGHQQGMVTRFAASLRTDNCPQPKEAQPRSHALTSE